MTPRVLIFASPTDLHSFAVQAGLRRQGVACDLLHASDLPRQLTLSVMSGTEPIASARGQSGSFASADYSVVWFRRPGQAVLPDWVTPDDQAHARHECWALWTGFVETFAPSAFWINPRLSRDPAQCKPLQQALALATGWNVPPTLSSNDPERIAEFLRLHPRVIYKPFTAVGWWDEQLGPRTQFATIIRPGDLDDREVVQGSPGIYQAYVDKDYELRVTVMGDRLFAARLDSQRTEHGRTDWRQAYDELTVSPARLPPEVASACRALMRRLGLVFGCLDIIVTPAGEHVFLEVNEMGQFLFIEQLGALPLLDAFCAFLRQGCADFTWDESRVAVRLQDVIEQANELSRQAQSEHVVPPLPFPVAQPR